MFKSMIKSFKAMSLAAGLLAAVSSTSFGQGLAVHLDAAPPTFNGECPARITFNGTIALNHPGTVRYRFIRSDGGRGHFVTLKFVAGGQENVTATWRLGGAGRHYAGWEAIQIVYPNGMISNRAHFEIKCEK
jgi:hypothetical protein